MTTRSLKVAFLCWTLAAIPSCGNQTAPGPNGPNASGGGSSGTGGDGFATGGDSSTGGAGEAGPYYPDAPVAPDRQPWTAPIFDPLLGAELGDDWHANDNAALAAIEKMYLPNGRFDTGWPWTFANAVEAVESSYVRSGGENQLHMIVGTYEKLNGQFMAEPGYDDQLWWAHTWIRAYDLTGNALYLNKAKDIFTNTLAGWDTTTCGGGIWWQKKAVYKNAITNELFLLVAASLHNRTPGDEGPDSYLDWAKKEWEWFSSSGMINDDGLVNDGLHDADPNACTNNGQTTWTYNQGIILGGLIELFEATGDTALLLKAEELADASTTLLVDENGVLVEPCGGPCNDDQVSFKGLYLRNLLRLYDWTHKSNYYDFMLRNARSVWKNARDDQNRLGSDWRGPFDMAGSTPQSSAMFALSALADKSSSASLFLRPSGSPTFTHEVGQPAELLAWVCSAAVCPTSGLLQGGPFVSSLPPGTHTLHVSLEVERTSELTEELVTLEVYDAKSAQVIASRGVAWNEWAEADVPQTFGVEFTHAADAALEFRIRWNAIPDAPHLVARDTWIDGEHSSSAANLSHECGNIDSSFHFGVDRHRAPSPCVLSRGPGLRLQAGEYRAHFEVKIDNIALEDAQIATLGVINTEENKLIASLPLSRTHFKTTLFHTFAVPFTAIEGYHYEFLVQWNGTPEAPRLVQRGVHLLRAKNELPVPLPFNVAGVFSPASLSEGRTIGLHSFVFSTESAHFVQGSSADIAVTPGNYESLELIDFAVGGTQSNQTYTLVYEDGSTENIVRSVSDWLAPAPEPDERIAFNIPYASPGGVGSYGNYHVFHRSLPVSSDKVLTAFRIPANGNLGLLAATLVSSP